MPFASVVSVGVTKPGIPGFARNWRVPVIGGLLKVDVAVAVRVTLLSKLIAVTFVVIAVVVKCCTIMGAEAEVTGA
jgi:hypothetical protein